jgi:hypothetical protein
MYERSQQAYYRDLPELLREHRWDSVAYHGDRRVGIAPSGEELYEKCRKEGLPEGEYVVLLILELAPQVRSETYHRSYQAFHRDLPELLKKHEGKWVAYHGDQRIGIARRATELYTRCACLGLHQDDIYVEFIIPTALYPDMETQGGSGGYAFHLSCEHESRGSE